MILFASPELKQGESYGLYTGEEKVVSFAISGQVTWLNESGVTTAPSGGMGGGMRPGGTRGRP